MVRLRDEERGVAAVEFAVLGLPFVVLTLWLFQLALVVLASSMLQNALVEASRQIRTGALQSATTTPTAASFVTLVCSNMSWLQSNCLTQLTVDVSTESQFTGATVPNPLATGTFNSSVLAFNPGTAGQIVVVRGFYQWPLIAPVLFSGLSQTGNGVDVLIETTTFVNEPY